MSAPLMVCVRFPYLMPNGRVTTRWIAALLAVALLAGCGGGSDDDGPAEAAPVAEGDFPRTVEHAMGTTEVPAFPETVIALDLSVVDSALALGLEVIGYTTFLDPEGDLPEHFGDALDEHAADATWVGDLSTPNLERIAGLQPDLILSSVVRHEDLYEELSAIAPTVMTESGGGGWKDGLLLVGEAVDRRDRAEALIAAYEARATAVGAAINEVAGSPTVSVVRFADGIRLYQPTSFSGTVLADAGIARPDSQQDPVNFVQIVSEEQLALADADVLLYTIYANDNVEAQFQAIQGRALWSSLGAVQRGDAHAVPDATWMSGVGIFGAHEILDDLLDVFAIDPATIEPTERP